MKKKINFAHLKKILTCQPFFVWNDIKSDDEKLTYEDHQIEFNLPSFVNTYNHSWTEIQNKSIDIIYKAFIKKIKLKYSELKTVPLGKTENREKITTNFLNNENNITLFNPVFIYNFQNYQIVSNPILYDLKTKTVAFLKMSTNTKRSDIIKIFFDVEVMRKIGLEIKKIDFYIIATKLYKKGEVDFFSTQFLNIQKNGPTFKDKNIVHYYQNAQLLKAGLTGEKNINIWDTIQNKKINNDFNFEDLDNYLQQIIYAKKYQTLDYLTLKDNQYLGDCYISWKTINQIVGLNEMKNFNGKLIKKEDIINQTPLNELLNKRLLLKKIIENPQQIFINELKVQSIIKNLENELTVWFDFEAFTLPICPLNNFLPFSHVISQVSIIKTEKMAEISVKNIVLDPKTINYNQLEKIVDAIYDDKAKYYIVYNASYEKSRLNDILFKMNEIKYSKIKKITKKVNEIINKIIDLADLFVVNSAQKIPPILITELKGMYSIKKLEKYINQKMPQIKYKIKKYENLPISNGLYALEITNNRALDIIGNNEWKVKQKQLAEYCENDVRAMIMVFYFVKWLLQNNNHNIKKL